jgi:hypothetical protein
MDIWNKEQLPVQWNKSTIMAICKRGDKTVCSNYRGIPILPVSCKIVSPILLSSLSPYIDEIIGFHQCGFRRNRSIID